MHGRIAPTGTLDTSASSAEAAVYVLATTEEGTRAALTSAKRLTDGLEARIVLLVPRLTSLAVPFDPASEERAAIVEAYRALAASVGADVTVLFCVSQRPDDVVRQMLGRSSLVIVGGRRNALWPSREQRLVRRLTAEGYPVALAQVGSEHASARVRSGRGPCRGMRKGSARC